MDNKSKWSNNLEEVYESSWKIHYKGIECKFELSSTEDAVLYHLIIPESMRNNGYGSDIIKFVEDYIRENTDAKILYIQIGASNGATKYVLQDKLNYNVTGVDDREELGQVVDAQKKLN